MNQSTKQGAHIVLAAPLALTPSPYIYVAKNDKGRGVYTRRRIKKNYLVEMAPVILGKCRHMTTPVIDNYTFEWDDAHYALALGYGSLYNHSYTPNLRYIALHKSQLIKFIARRDIAMGEELTINYGPSPWSKNRMPFEVKP